MHTCSTMPDAHAVPARPRCPFIGAYRWFKGPVRTVESEQGKVDQDAYISVHGPDSGSMSDKAEKYMVTDDRGDVAGGNEEARV